MTRANASPRDPDPIPHQTCLRRMRPAVSHASVFPRIIPRSHPSARVMPQPNPYTRIDAFPATAGWVALCSLGEQPGSRSLTRWFPETSSCHPPGLVRPRPPSSAFFGKKCKFFKPVRGGQSRKRLRNQVAATGRGSQKPPSLARCRGEDPRTALCRPRILPRLALAGKSFSTTRTVG